MKLCASMLLSGALIFALSACTPLPAPTHTPTATPTPTPTPPPADPALLTVDGLYADISSDTVYADEHEKSDFGTDFIVGDEYGEDSEPLPSESPTSVAYTAPEDYSGTYTRNDGAYSGATLTVLMYGYNSIDVAGAISGNAWFAMLDANGNGPARSGGVDGEITRVSDNIYQYVDPELDNSLTLVFNGDGLEVSEIGMFGGEGATFAGTFVKTQ